MNKSRKSVILRLISLRLWNTNKVDLWREYEGLCIRLGPRPLRWVRACSRECVMFAYSRKCVHVRMREYMFTCSHLRAYMYAGIFACVIVCIFALMCACSHAWTLVYVFAYMRACSLAFACVYIYRHVCVRDCVLVCLSACSRECVYVCIFACVYVYRRIRVRDCVFVCVSACLRVRVRVRMLACVRACVSARWVGSRRPLSSRWAGPSTRYRFAASAVAEREAPASLQVYRAYLYPASIKFFI